MKDRLFEAAILFICGCLMLAAAHMYYMVKDYHEAERIVEQTEQMMELKLQAKKCAAKWPAMADRYRACVLGDISR